MFKNIAGQKFGLLTAIERTNEMRWGVSMWRCRCQCGGESIAAVNSLKSGMVQSCGCLRSTSAKKRSDAHGERGSGAYKSWDGMIQRCTNPFNKSFPRYGGAGVTVCEEWIHYLNFKRDMGERPAGMSLDRIDPHGNYEPMNCRWADELTQSRNKRKPVTCFAQAEEVRRLYSEGVKPSEIQSRLGISKGSVNGIIFLGQITTP